MRALLIQGALAYVYRMKEPKCAKDIWLRDLIDRAGPRRAAVALANKNARTAWALVTQGTEYPLNCEWQVSGYSGHGRLS